MSTSCGIAVRAGETFNTIYCHHDGYPKYMLSMLRENYNSFDLANMLISMGDASSINQLIGPNPNRPHDFANPQEDVCVFYHRDRGEDWISCQSVCYTKRDLLKQRGFEFIYIFEDNTWNVYTNGRKLNK